MNRSLRGKILVRALAIGLIPLALIGAITLGSLLGLSRSADQTLEAERQELGNEVAGQRLRTEARAVAQELDGFLHERISDVTGWASDPTITDSAIAAAERSQAYAATSNDALEDQFADDKEIGAAAEARAFLRNQLDRETAFSSIFFTERNGFNVTGTGEVDDFVQRDEDWWVSTQIRGLHFGAIERSETEGTYTLPLSARVKNPATGEGFGGVLRAGLGIELLQQVATRNAGLEGRQVTILTGDGLLLAETRSENDTGRIMRPGATFDEERERAAGRALAAREPGFIVQDDIVVGYAPLRSVRDRSGGTATDINAFLGIDANPINWVIMVEQPTDLAFAELQGLAAVREGLSRTAVQLTAVGVVALLLAAIGATTVSGRLSRSIVQPLLSLRRIAYDISERQLPELVQHVQSAEADDELPSVPAVRIKTDDEVEDVAEAFNVVRDTAVDLAAQQARSRRVVSTMFINLGRRNQGLLRKQLEFIDELERDESDPRLLNILFRLDHLATRMRRNAESLLVLADEETPRRYVEPIPLSEVVRGAVSEIEEYQRIEQRDISDVMVVGSAASDLSHLLAELLENATNFSPPDTPVTVIGWWVAEGYALSIVDQGIGMTDEELHNANERLRTSAKLERVPASYLGLFVVGRLAARYDITVRIVESAAEGVVAKVFLPRSLVAGDPPGTPQPSTAAVTDQRSREATHDGGWARRRAPSRTPVGGPAASTGATADRDTIRRDAQRARERLGGYQRAVEDGRTAISSSRDRRPPDTRRP